MLIANRGRNVALCVVATLMFTGAGCRGGAVEAAGSASVSDVSAPPTLNAEYGARNARVCAKVTSRPDVATAMALVQCGREGVYQSSLFLVTDLQLEIGSARPLTTMDTDLNDLDASSKIYPLRGQGTNWSCGLVSQWGQGTNCQKWPATPGQTGRCWHTTFGDWKCSMGVGGSNWVSKQAGPTTY